MCGGAFVERRNVEFVREPPRRIRNLGEHVPECWKPWRGLRIAARFSLVETTDRDFLGQTTVLAIKLHVRL